MNSTGSAILMDPDPCAHIVYPYTDDTQVTEAVRLFTTAGLRKGEAVLLILTGAHRSLIRKRLEADGFDLRALEASGQLVCEDAESLLRSFMFDGIVDEHRFKLTIGRMILTAKMSIGSLPNRQVRVFGEMVDLIWEAHPSTTLRFEELWNEIIEAHSVPLLCAYALAGPKAVEFPQALMACHSHVV